MGEEIKETITKPVDAYWDISLYVTCPWCLEYVDLLDYADFFDGESRDLGEMLNVKNETVVCPECGEDFIANFNW